MSETNKCSRGTTIYSRRIAELVLQKNHTLSAQEREQMISSIVEHYPNLSSEKLYELSDEDLANEFLEMLRNVEKKNKSRGEEE